MTNKDQQQLGKTLWNIANDLRGAMNAELSPTLPVCYQVALARQRHKTLKSKGILREAPTP